VTRSLLSRVSWGVAGQAVSSATNFTMSAAAAGASDVREFGAVAVAFSMYLVGLGLCRAFSCQPLLIGYSTDTGPSIRSAVQPAASCAVGIGALIGSCMAVSGLLFAPPLGSLLLLMGASLPALLLQDLWRFAFVASARPRLAAMNDLAWLMVLLTGCLILTWLGEATAFRVVAVWCLGALVAAAIGMVQWRIVASPWEVGSWLAQNWSLSSRYVVESVGVLAGSQLVLNVLALVGGLQAAAALRGAQVAFGPITMLLQGAQLAIIPEIVRKGDDLKAARLLGRRTSQVLAAATATGALLLVAVPERVGSAVLGETWSAASPVLLPVGFGMAATAATIGPLSVLHARRAATRTMQIRLTILPFATVGGLVGVLIGNAIGAALGLAVANLAGLAVSVVHLRRQESVDQRRPVDQKGHSHASAAHVPTPQDAQAVL